MSDEIGVYFGFDMTNLDKAIASANKEITMLANKSQIASKQINEALASIGAVEPNVSSVEVITNKLVTLKEKIESIKKEYSKTTNKGTLKYLEEEGAKAATEMNKVLGLLEKIHDMNSLYDPAPVHKLIERRDTLKDIVKHGGTYSGEGEDKVFKPISNEQYAKYVDELETLKEEIRLRQMSKKQAVENAEKEAIAEAKANEKIARDKRKLYDEIARIKRAAQQDYNTSYEGALAFGDSAQGGTINRQLLAVKNLEAARNKLSSSDSEYLSKVRTLNDAINKLKINVDALTKSHNGQEESVSSIRAEYKAINNEMLSLDKAFNKSSEATKRFGKTAQTSASEDIMAERYIQLENRKLEIEKEHLKDVSDLQKQAQAKLNAYLLEEYKRLKTQEELEDKKKKSKRQKEIDDARAEYKKISEELAKNRDALTKSKKAKAKYGDNYSGEDSEASILARINKLNERKLELEKRFRYQLFKTQQELNSKANRAEIAEAEKVAKEKAKIEADALEEKIAAKQRRYLHYLTSYEGAMNKSSKANTIKKEKEAIKLLEAARENVAIPLMGEGEDKDSYAARIKPYTEQIKALTKEIDRHRLSIEAKTKSQEEEKTLLPSVRSEYSRILKDIHDLTKAKNALNEVETKNEKDSGLYEQKAAIEARLNDLNEKKKELEDSAQGQLDTTKRKHDARIAREELDAFVKKEREKIKIAEEYEEKIRSIDSSEAKQIIDESKNANNVRKHTEAIKKLKEARERLDEKDKNYKKTLNALNREIDKHSEKIDKVKSSSERLKKAQHHLMDISGQLARKFALLFSVSAIQNYVNNLVSIRGEFEMQQRSLQVLLQNKDDANELWDKTVALAVKSPFRIKDLVTYTKQLAAYRVETEKLYETNKMLADVSAGLGVDMNRLILAFGQVKAANFLRGTELRQFSEAGVNMLDELARYFTEIEGRAISVADVFDRVSKRMVSFADVEEIFKRITSEGGIFYQMQEKQSETLKGMTMNLRDSFDLMMNDIGKQNDGVLKMMVQLTKTLVDNWREFVPYINAAGMAFVTYFGLERLRAFGKLLANIYRSFKALIATGSMAANANPWILLATAISSVVVYLYSAEDAADKLADAMSEVDREITSQLEESIDLYRKLVETINDATKNYEERNRAMSNLKTKFEEILPDQYLEMEYISNITDNYKEATLAMINYYNAKAREQKKSRIEQQFDSELYETDIPELQESIKKRFEDKMAKNRDFQFTDEEILKAKAGINGIVNAVIEDAKSGVVKIENISDEIEKRLAKYIGVTKDKVHKLLEEFMLYNEDIEDIQETLTERQSALSGIAGLPFETYDQHKAANEINKQKENIKQIEAMFSKASGLYEKYAKALKDGNKDYAQTLLNDANSILEKMPASLSIYKNFIKKTFDEMKESAEKGTFEFSSTIQLINSRLYSRIVSALGKLEKPSNSKELNEAITNLREEMIKKWRSLVPTNFQETLSKVFQEAASRNKKSDINIFAKMFPKMGENLSTVRTNIKGEYEAWKKMLEEWETSGETKISSKWLEGIFTTTKERIEFIKNNLPTLELAMKMLGEESTGNKGGREREAIKILKNRISLIKELYSQYNKIHEKFDKDASKKQVIESYAETFKKAFEGTSVDFSDIVKIDDKKLKEVAETLSEDVRKELEELREKGSYIRDFSKDYVKKLVGEEGHKNEAYLDPNGIPTIGNGFIRDHLGNKVKMGDVWSDKKIIEERTIQMEQHAKALNKVLDANKDLIITQKQYNALMDLTWQSGGAGAAIKYAKDIQAFKNWLEKINGIDITNGRSKGDGRKVLGQYKIDINQILEDYKKLDNVYERIAFVMKYVGIRTRDLHDTNKGMLDRAERRAILFGKGLEVSKELKRVLVDISAIDFTSPEGLVEILERLMPIAQKEGAEAILTLTRAISEFKSEFGIIEKELSDKDLLAGAEQIFGEYEMSLQLRDSNISEQLAKDVFKISTTSIDELKKNIESIKPLFIGKDMLVEYEKIKDKIKEYEEKERIERLKKYTQYLVEAQNERVRLKIEELKKIEEVENEANYTKEQKSFIKDSIRKETNKDVDKAKWEEFKGTELYTYLFTDLEFVGTKTIKTLYDKLKELKDSLKELPDEQYKDLIQEMEKLDDLKVERNPFSVLKEAREEIRGIGMSYKELQDMLLKSEEDKSKYEEELYYINLILSSKEQGVQISEEDAKEANKYQTIQGKTIKELEERRDLLKRSIGIETEISKEANSGLGSYKKWGKAVEGVKDNVQKWGDAFKEALKGVDMLLDAFGVAEDSSARLWIENINHIIDMVVQVVILTAALTAMGVAANSALGVIGWVAMALQGVAMIFASIFGMGDKKKERQIKKEIEYVKELEKQYEKLEKAIENAYSVDTLKRSMELSEENIEKQITSYERMIQLEEDKKKTNDDKIKEWKDTIEKLKEQQEELRKSTVEEMGGSYDYRSAAREFLDAWLDAFEETGDGLNGLESHFKDFIKNVIAQQAVMKGLGNIIQPIIDSVNKSLEGDYEISDKEWDNIGAIFESQADLADKFLKEYYDRFPELFEDKGSLSTLQESIQGITEDTAQILEAYLNSVRLYVADSNAKLTKLADSLLNTDNENPMLSQLKIIARQTEAIRRLFDSVVMPSGHTQGGAGIKVFMQ